MLTYCSPANLRMYCCYFYHCLQLKDLLQPYGQLKSLSVAMDASTGKNKVRVGSVGLC